jgi:hypothetical protein
MAFREVVVTEIREVLTSICARHKAGPAILTAPLQHQAQCAGCAPRVRLPALLWSLGLAPQVGT